MEFAVVGKCSGMLEYMFKPMPGFVQGESALELLPTSGAIVHSAAPTGDTVGFLSPVGIDPHDFLSGFDGDIMRFKK